MDKQLSMRPDSYMKFTGEQKEMYDAFLDISRQNGWIEINLSELDNRVANRDTEVTIDGKEVEPQFNIDGVALSNRYKTGKIGELAVEKVLGIKFSDIGTKGESYKYSNPDLLEAGYNLGCKCAKVGNGLLIPKKCKEDQIIVLYDDVLNKAYILGIVRLEDIQKYWSKSYVQSVNAYNEGVKLGFINFDVIQPAKNKDTLFSMLQKYKVGPEYKFVPKITRGILDILNKDKVAFIDIKKDTETGEVFIYSITNSSSDSLINVKKVPFSLDYLSSFNLIVGGDSYFNGNVMSIDRQIITTQYSNLEKYISNSTEICILDIDKEMKRVFRKKYTDINLSILSSSEIDMLASKSIEINRNLIDNNNVFISSLLLTLVEKCKYVSREVSRGV